ncbi:DUF3969 family protein [Enterococcus sp. AZ192]|uniref:DUF3969 family protein n=1 Tax=unclassified Enterococcus TaxID=2608891 RepID=UPI003D2A64DD
MVINLEDQNTTEIYLSIVSLGLLKCIEEGILNYDDAMALLYQPFNIEKLEAKFPELGSAIHLGSELEDVASLIPEKLETSIREIEKMNKELIISNINKFREDDGLNSPIYDIN